MLRFLLVPIELGVDIMGAFLEVVEEFYAVFVVGLIKEL
jgi:hypothetical protein